MARLALKVHSLLIIVTILMGKELEVELSIEIGKRGARDNFVTGHALPLFLSKA